MRMKYRTFSVRIPEEIARLLDADAQRRFFKNHARTQLITEILVERYREELKEFTAKSRRRVRRARPKRSADSERAKEQVTGFPEEAQG